VSHLVLVSLAALAQLSACGGGGRVCTAAAPDGSEITSACVNENDIQMRVGSRVRRFLLTGHQNGRVQVWDLTTAYEHSEERSSLLDVKRVHRTRSGSSATLLADVDSPSFDVVP